MLNFNDSTGGGPGDSDVVIKTREFKKEVLVVLYFYRTAYVRASFSLTKGSEKDVEKAIQRLRYDIIGYWMDECSWGSNFGVDMLATMIAESTRELAWSDMGRLCI